MAKQRKFPGLEKISGSTAVFVLAAMFVLLSAIAHRSAGADV